MVRQHAMAGLLS